MHAVRPWLRLCYHAAQRWTVQKGSLAATTEMTRMWQAVAKMLMCKLLTGVASEATLRPLPRVVTSVVGGCVSGGSDSGRFTPSRGSVSGVVMRPLPPPPKSFDKKPPAWHKAISFV